MSESPVSNEVNQQFLRRTPIKLRQFSRLLDDMLTQKIDPLRVKALLSQVNKTREACLAQNFDTTARLLNQIFKHLSLSDDALESQKPLLKRFSAKLQEHSEKLELGVRPQKEVVQEPPETDTQKADQGSSAPGESLSQEDSVDQTLEEQGIYLDKGVIIFVSGSGARFLNMGQQFQSLGVDVFHANNIAQAKQHAVDNPGSIIVAPLKFAETTQQLGDEEIESSRIPLIYTADEDSQADRLLALRSGGTGYLVEPVSISGLLELIERQYDIHADSPYRILVMEDSKAQARYYEKVLMKGHFDIRVVNDPAVLLEALRGFDPETVLMDMQMPGCSGIELTRLIRQMPRYAYLPIIFLSAEENQRKQNQALLSGGTSFIVKPVEKQQLMFLADLYCRRYRELNPQIESNPDTGLVYSPQFKNRLSVEASRLSRSTGTAALAVLELDEAENLIKSASFSLLNVAITQLALLLKKRLRKSDIMGHLETGQLGVILTTGNKADWTGIMDEIRLQFAELPFHSSHQDKPLTISIGMSMLQTSSDAHNWLAQSLQELSKAKSEDGDQIQAGRIS